MSLDSRSKRSPLTTLPVENLPVTRLALMTQLTTQETMKNWLGGKKPVSSQTNTGKNKAYLPRIGTKLCTIFARSIVITWLTGAWLSAMAGFKKE